MGRTCTSSFDLGAGFWRQALAGAFATWIRFTDGGLVGFDDGAEEGELEATSDAALLFEAGLLLRIRLLGALHKPLNEGSIETCFALLLIVAESILIRYVHTLLNKSLFIPLEVVFPYEVAHPRGRASVLKKAKLSSTGLRRLFLRVPCTQLSIKAMKVSVPGLKLG